MPLARKNLGTFSRSTFWDDTSPGTPEIEFNEWTTVQHELLPLSLILSSDRCMSSSLYCSGTEMVAASVMFLLTENDCVMAVVMYLQKLLGSTPATSTARRHFTTPRTHAHAHGQLSLLSSAGRQLTPGVG